MKTVTVYRVEATRGPKKGHGPYSAYPDFSPHTEARWEAMRLFNSADEQHPSPFEEGALAAIESYEFCGFTSQRALRRWFRRGALRVICRTGFYALMAYEVPREAVRRGTYQVVFVKDHAISRRELCPVTLRPKVSLA